MPRLLEALWMIELGVILDKLISLENIPLEAIHYLKVFIVCLVYLTFSNFCFIGILLVNLPYRGAVSPRSLATMDRQSSLRLIICSSSTGLVPPPTAFERLSRSFILGLPLPLLPSNLPVMKLLSNCWRRITWPRNLSCIHLIILIYSLLAPTRFKAFRC